MRDELTTTLSHVKEAYKKRAQGQDNSFDCITNMELRLIMQLLEDSIYFCCDGCKQLGRSPEMSPDCKLCRRKRNGYDMYTPMN